MAQKEKPTPPTLNGLEAAQRLLAGQEFPDGLIVKGGCYLNSTRIQTLPDYLIIHGALDVSGCTALTKLSKRMKVDGYLCCMRCTALEEVPEGISVKGNLDLSGCSALKSLPARMQIRGSLDIRRTGIRELPHDLWVGQCIYIDSFERLGLPKILDRVAVKR